MSVKARCLNYTGCLLAYRGEVIEIAPNSPLVCPECGKTVSVTQGKGGGVGKIIGLVVLLLVLGAGVYFALPYIKRIISKDPESTEVTPATPTPISSTGNPTPRLSVPANSTPAIVTNIPVATPILPTRIDLSLKKAENQQVRDEVLKRIDDIPKLSQQNRDKLYNSVSRAKSMGLIITIPFSSGNARIPAGEVPGLKAQLERPEILKLREDPTYVFVVLGYADAKGDEAKNLAISRTRAESVLEAMRDKCGIDNVMHAVAMGGSKLLDPNNLEKNRIVEVWAVLP